jgi:DNA-directed RNA polymerase subunit RPC12/RpoP
MNYQCPRCGKPVERRHHTTAGLVSALLHLALGRLQCESCGTIPLDEFPAETRSRITLHSTLLIISAAAVVVLSMVALMCERFL